MKLTKRERDMATSLLRAISEWVVDLDEDCPWDCTHDIMLDVRDFLKQILHPQTQRTRRKKK